MKARLIRATDGSLQLLYRNGSIDPATPEVLINFLSNFKNVHRFGNSETKWTETCTDMTLYPGETLGFVSDSEQLILSTFEPFFELLEEKYTIKKYTSVPEYAKKYGKSREIIKVFCREGRILGATKKGNTWMIPEDAPYPVPIERQREGYRGPRKRKAKQKSSQPENNQSEEN